MFKFASVLAASTAAVMIFAAPAFAADTFTLAPMLVADIAHDVAALRNRTDTPAADR
jgi:hypothetical protein